MGVVTTEQVKPRRLPGVEGIWVFIGADSVIFAILFLSFMQDRLRNPALFEASRHTLNMHLGGIDTLILLTSSWSVALAVQAMKRDEIDREPRLLFGGAVAGRYIRPRAQVGAGIRLLVLAFGPPTVGRAVPLALPDEGCLMSVL